MWGFPSVETVLRDVRYAIRILRRSPMFAAIAILSLGIGIGSAAAVFTLVDAVLLRKLPVANPDELVLLRWFAPATARMPAQSLSGNWNVNDRGQNSTSFSLPTFESLRSDAPAGVRVVGFAGYMSFNVAIDGVPETGEGQSVSGNYFDTLGLAPAAGRLLTEADDRVGAAPVAVLSYAFWQQRFGGSPAAIGRAISLNAVPVTIVGVMPRKFQSTLQVGETPQVAIPLTLRAALERSAELPPGRFLVGIDDGAAAEGRESVEVAAIARRALPAECCRRQRGIDDCGLAAARVPAGSARSDRVPRRNS